MDAASLIGPIVLGGIGTVVIAGGALLARQWRNIPSSQILVVTGKWGERFVSGTATLVVPILEKEWQISKKLQTVGIVKKGVLTEQYVPVDIEGVVQYRLKDETEFIKNAVTSFLGSNPQEITEKVEETLDGHIRAICAKMDVSQLITDRNKFRDLVIDNAETDLNQMGLTIISFTIKEISDPNNYIETLYAPEIADKKKMADIAEANARRDARKAIADADRDAFEKEKAAEILKAKAEKSKEVESAKYKKEQEIEWAETNKAGPIRDAEKEQVLKEAQMQVKVIEMEKAAEVALKTQEVERLAGAAIREKMVEVAEGEAKKVKLAGDAEASAIKAKAVAEADGEKAALLAAAEGKRQSLLAEAEGALEKAKAFQELDEQGLKVMMIEKAPAVAQAVAQPLQKMGRVTVIQTGEGKEGLAPSLMDTVLKGVAAVPEVMRATDFSELFNELKNAAASDAPKK